MMRREILFIKINVMISILNFISKPIHDLYAWMRQGTTSVSIFFVLGCLLVVMACEK